MNEAVTEHVRDDQTRLCQLPVIGKRKLYQIVRAGHFPPRLWLIFPLPYRSSYKSIIGPIADKQTFHSYVSTSLLSFSSFRGLQDRIAHPAYSIESPARWRIKEIGISCLYFKGSLESHVIKSRQALNNQIRISSTFKGFRPSLAHLSSDASIDLEWCSYHTS